MNARNRAFTLVELLVVIGIIAVLIGILLPVLGRARSTANNVKCKANLTQINLALRMYANDNRDHYPDPYTIGGSSFRVAPGLRTPDDPFAKPEVYGLPAVLHGIGEHDDVLTVVKRHPKYLAGQSAVWVCPSSRTEHWQYGNTYAWSINATISKQTSGERGRVGVKADRNAGRLDNVLVVWDNYAFLPFLSGARKGTGGADKENQVASNARFYVHNYRSSNRAYAGSSAGIKGSINVIFANGQIGTAVYGPPHLVDGVMRDFEFVQGE